MVQPISLIYSPYFRVISVRKLRKRYMYLGFKCILLGVSSLFTWRIFPTSFYRRISTSLNTVWQKHSSVELLNVLIDRHRNIFQVFISMAQFVTNYYTYRVATWARDSGHGYKSTYVVNRATNNWDKLKASAIFRHLPEYAQLTTGTSNVLATLAKFPRNTGTTTGNRRHVGNQSLHFYLSDENLAGNRKVGCISLLYLTLASLLTIPHRVSRSRHLHPLSLPC